MRAAAVRRAEGITRPGSRFVSVAADDKLMDNAYSGNGETDGNSWDIARRSWMEEWHEAQAAETNRQAPPSAAVRVPLGYSKSPPAVDDAGGRFHRVARLRAVCWSRATAPLSSVLEKARGRGHRSCLTAS